MKTLDILTDEQRREWRRNRRQIMVDLGKINVSEYTAR